MTSCFMIGHRECMGDILPRVEAAAEWVVQEKGVDTFFIGHYGGFDRIAAAAIRQVKQRNPQVKLVMVLPYHPASRPIELPNGFDESYYPEGMERVPLRYAIVQANRRMVDQADFLIVAVSHPASNAKAITDYAARRGKPIVNVLDETAKT